MVTHERFDVILPAGGRISGDFALRAGTEIKTLITFEGETILYRTLRALRQTERVKSIVVIGPPEVLNEAEKLGVEGLLPEGMSGPANILLGLKWLYQAHTLENIVAEVATTVRQQQETSFRTLILTTDLPFVTPEGLIRFLDSCSPDADIVVPVITQAEFDAAYPNSGSTYTPLKDAAITIGGAFLVNSAVLLGNEKHLHDLFDARKSPLKMARLIGFGTILRYLTRQLTIAQLVDRAGQIARCRGVALRGMPPELAYDIDEPYEFDYARKLCPA